MESMEANAKVQNSLLELSRSFRLLSLCNQALLRADDEPGLLAEVCRLVVDTGGYPMAWIGMAQQDADKSIRAVAGCGSAGDYPENPQLTWADTEQGRAPAGVAIRTGVTQVSRNFLDNPALAPWRDDALAHGYQSSIALPLVVDGNVLGALSIYASIPDAFAPEEVGLLEELAANLAYGIQVQRLRAHAESVERQYQGNQARYQQIVEMTSEGIWSLDAERKTDFVNAALCRKLGYRPDEMLGHPVDDFVFAEDREQFRQGMQERQSAGKNYKYEQRLRCKDGSERWFLVYGTPLTDAHGLFGGAFAVLADITERRQMEEQLLAVQAELTATLDAIPDLLFEMGLDGRYYNIRAQHSHLLAAPPDNLIGKLVSDVLAPEAAAICLEALQAANKYGYTSGQQIALNLDGGAPTWFELSIARKRGGDTVEPRFIVLSRDITARKEIELAYKESVTNLDVAQHITGVGSWEMTLPGRKLRCSRELYNIFEIDRTRFIATQEAFLDIIHPEDREQVRQVYADFVASQSCYEFTYRLLMPDGRVKWANERGETFCDDRGRPYRSIGTVQDITQRKNAEVMLQETESQYRVAIETSPDAFWVVDMLGCLTDVNEAYVRMSGYSREELIGMSIPDLDAHDDAAMVAAHMEEIISSSGHVRFETEHRRKDGTVWPVQITTTFAPIQGGRFLAFLTDLTAHRQAERDLQKARESAYRDVLVREVHHRIKNNLQGVIGTLRMSASAHPQLAEPIQTVIGQIRSIAVLHGMQGRTGLAQVGLCELAAAVAENAETMWQRKIAFHIPEKWRVSVIAESEAVPTALILNELFANAIKYCTPDGSVSIRLFREGEQPGVTIFIYNNGTIPQGFGLDKPELLGTGLQLVSALMPRAGVHLHWEQDMDRVATVFQCDEPVIQLSETYFPR